MQCKTGLIRGNLRVLPLNCVPYSKCYCIWFSFLLTQTSWGTWIVYLQLFISIWPPLLEHRSISRCLIGIHQQFTLFGCDLGLKRFHGPFNQTSTGTNWWADLLSSNSLIVNSLSSHLFLTVLYMLKWAGLVARSQAQRWKSERAVPCPSVWCVCSQTTFKWHRNVDKSLLALPLSCPKRTLYKEDK